MNSKFLFFALYVFSVFFLIQFFFPGDTNTDQSKNSLRLSIQDDSLVIPNLPKIEFINSTLTGFQFSPCSDLKISINSELLGKINEARPEFCTPIEVLPGGNTQLSFDALATLLAASPGEYMITATTPSGERSISFSLEKPGTFRSLLTTLFYNPIYNLFVALLTFLPGHPLGWAILIITLIIRFILLVPQHHMLESQKKLQVIQPKIKELQQKYKDDQSKLGMEMLELYKKEGVNPMGSCLPLLIQMPILIGLYWVISGITDVANFYHLYPIFAGFNPQDIDAHFYGVDLLQVGGTTALFFGIALAGVQYIQARLSFGYTPTPPKKEKKELKEGEMPEIALDPEMMKKMMLYFFPIMIAVSAFFFPLGVGLYWFIGTLFVIAQQWYVNKVKPKKSKKHGPEEESTPAE